jgi:dsDNA-specific endonuclease/ATPase MutS2
VSAAEAPYFFNASTVSYVEGLERQFLRMLELRELIEDKADGNPDALEQAKRELREIRRSMRQEHVRLQDEFRPYLELPASYLTLPSTRAATMKW